MVAVARRKIKFGYVCLNLSSDHYKFSVILVDLILTITILAFLIGTIYGYC